MLNLYLSLFSLIAALAFLALWLEDRGRWYLLCWGVTNLTGPIIVYASARLTQQASPEFSYYTAVYALSAGITCAGLALGAHYYRGLRFNLAWRVSIYCLVTAGLWLLSSTTDFLYSRLLFIVMIMVVYLRVATLIWSERLIARVGAVLFALKAMTVLTSVKFMFGADKAYDSDLALAFTASVAALDVVLLLLLSFHKGAADLKHNIRFLHILQSLTSVIHNASTEAELGREVLKTMLKQPFWTSGVLMKISADRNYLEWVHIEGDLKQAQEAPKIGAVPLAGTLAEAVLAKGKAVDLADEAIKSLPLNAKARELHNTMLKQERVHMIVPVTNRGVAVGVMAMTDHKNRPVFQQELDTLTSIGEVIGFAFENLKQLEALDFRASHDTLTGLGNRAKLHEFCTEKLSDSPYSLMLFDLNSFKEVNDVFGHGVGDKMLQALATRLSDALLGQASLFRLGGDEFVVVYPETTGLSVQTTVRSLLELITQPVHVGALRLQSGVSIGVVDSNDVGNDSHELLRCADLAMYQAKHSDASIAYYDKTYDADVRARIELLADVNEALVKHQFELYYQPLIDIKGKACVACEGLLRWHHPTRGLLSAAEFIPVVETTDQIETVTHRVIELALQDLAAWRRQGIDMRVAINLSARNFLDPSLPDFLEDCARAYGVPTHMLQLEITETVLMKDAHVAEQITARLHRSGFQIVLDDFGTGYSSLAYLGRFPISVVKIDRSFVANMSRDSRSKNIVEATIGLTHKLGFVVTAEGIENQHTASLLETLQCDYGQGFFYAKPLSKTNFDDWYQHYSQTVK